MNSKLGDVDSKFRFIILAAKRTRQLQSGARPMIASVSKKFTRVAMEELSQGLVGFDITEEELPKRRSHRPGITMNPAQISETTEPRILERLPRH